MILGKFTKDDKNYVEVAKREKAAYFDLGDEWGVIEKKYGLDDAEMFEIFNCPAMEDSVNNEK